MSRGTCGRERDDVGAIRVLQFADDTQITISFLGLLHGLATDRESSQRGLLVRLTFLQTILFRRITFCVAFDVDEEAASALLLVLLAPESVRSFNVCALLPFSLMLSSPASFCLSRPLPKPRYSKSEAKGEAVNEVDLSAYRHGQRARPLPPCEN